MANTTEEVIRYFMGLRETWLWSDIKTWKSDTTPKEEYQPLVKRVGRTLIHLTVAYRYR